MKIGLFSKNNKEQQEQQRTTKNNKEQQKTTKNNKRETTATYTAKHEQYWSPLTLPAVMPRPYFLPNVTRSAHFFFLRGCCRCTTTPLLGALLSSPLLPGRELGHRGNWLLRCPCSRSRLSCCLFRYVLPVNKIAPSLATCTRLVNH